MKIRYDGPLQGNLKFFLYLPHPQIAEIIEDKQIFFQLNMSEIENFDWKWEKKNSLFHSPKSSWRSESTLSRACSPSKLSSTSGGGGSRRRRRRSQTVSRVRRATDGDWPARELETRRGICWRESTAVKFSVTPKKVECWNQNGIETPSGTTGVVQRSPTLQSVFSASDPFGWEIIWCFMKAYYYEYFFFIFLKSGAKLLTLLAGPLNELDCFSLRHKLAQIKPN